METSYLITGHSHKQYMCVRDGKMIINPGSVGMPQGNGCRSQYLLLDISDSGLQYTFRQVDYDIEETVRQQFRSGLIEYGGYWALGDIYGVVTGGEYTKELLGKIYSLAASNKDVLGEEHVWAKLAAEMGLKNNEEDVLKLIKNTI